ncbi:MAG TPA: SOS response-associated peptidase [Afifellaceae bacterium]|nr:SOS response-associated peptidase [Afifellaceae bacterium]
MCGRFTLQTTAEEAELFFGLTGVDERFLVPRFNISPTQPIAVVREGETGRELVPMRWGFWPSWVKDPNTFPLLINARSDGVATKNSFRNAFKRRRCLIPATGFYEWQAAGKGPKQPFWIAPPSTANARLIAFAGLWETWSGADGSEVDTAAIITTDANAALAPIHHRMPAIIEPERFDDWLVGEKKPDELMPMLDPPPADRLVAVPVSTRVNAARNDDEDLIRPVEIAPGGSEPDKPQEDPDEQPTLL